MSTDKFRNSEPERVEGSLNEDEAIADSTVNNLQVAVASDVADNLAVKERIDLGIDWNSLDRESLFKSMKKYDNAENIYPKVPGNGHDTFMLHRAELNTVSGEKIVMEFYKIISTYNNITLDELCVRMTRPSIDPGNVGHHCVAGFDFLRHKHNQSEEWDMKHRETLEAYRKQGIADKVVCIAEEIFKHRSEDNNLEQSISVNSGQKDLTTWLLNSKRGFVPATKDDADRLERLSAKENGLQEVTMNGETYTFDSAEFISKFRNSLSGPEDPAVWNPDNYSQPFFYMKSCFKIKLKKNI